LKVIKRMTRAMHASTTFLFFFIYQNAAFPFKLYNYYEKTIMK
jgi:hypothetical protein